LLRSISGNADIESNRSPAQSCRGGGLVACKRGLVVLTFKGLPPLVEQLPTSIGGMRDIARAE
jgi:hypothetical protein